MSNAKRQLRKVIVAWLSGGSAPQVLRRCDTCGETAWRPLEATIRHLTIDARLPNNQRADALFTDESGGIQLVVQLEGGSGLENRARPQSGLPVLVVRGANLIEDPERWIAVREHGLQGWRCRCAGTRALHIVDDFSLRTIGCPIRLRHDGQQFYARAIEDCGRCAFFVGIGYGSSDRRSSMQLRCGFGAPPVERRPPIGATLLRSGARREIMAGT